MNLLKNIHIKLLAVVSALLLWLFVVGVENYVYVFPTELPVKIINLGQNVSVANELAKVKVRYKATDNTGANINSNEFELFLDAQNLNEGSHSLEVNFISKNPKITVVAIEPPRLDLYLESITSKEVTVSNTVSGTPAKGFDLKSVKLSQDKIKISGAASVLAGITDLPIRVSLDGTENADFSRKITVEAPADWKLSGKTISFDPSVIQADIAVRKSPKAENVVNSGAVDNKPIVDKTNWKKKTLMAQITKDASLGSAVKELLPENILVTVEGEQSEIDKLNNDSVKLRLMSGKIAGGYYTVTAGDIVIPAGVAVEIVEFSPAKVLVKF